MGMTREEFHAWLDEQESEQEKAAEAQEIMRLLNHNFLVGMAALETLPDEKTWTPSRADIKEGILTYADLVLDALRRAVEGDDGPTED